MPQHDIETVLDWRGSTVVDRDGEKIGTFEELYLDHADRPAWAAVKTGLFGLRQTFIPLTEARPVDDRLQVPYDKGHVEDAPNIDPDAQLTEDEEGRLYRHYELSPADAGEDDREVAAHDGEPPPANDRAGEDDADGDAPAAMTRSEEELIVGTRRRVSERVRLKKYVVTEHVQKTVPVRREEVRVEYEPEEGPADR